MDILFEKKDAYVNMVVAKVVSNTNELFEKISGKLSSEELDRFNKMKNEKRKKEWLGTRLLYEKMNGNYNRIKYDSNGKPYSDCSNNISISHSNNIISIILSEKNNPGIDVEKISLKVAKTALKFIEQRDIDTFGDEDKIKSIYLNWCGKETLYKIYSKGGIDFKEDLSIDIQQIKEIGIINSEIKNKAHNKKYSLNYKFFKNNDSDFLLVWYAGD